MAGAGYNSIFCVGLNHRTAAAEVRELVALDGPGKERLRERLSADEELRRSIIVSTCNRTELYGCLNGSRALGPALVDDLRPAVFPRLPTSTHPYLHDGWATAFHLFRVAAGLDSMILGESEIQRQVKAAFDESLEQGEPARVLQDLFRQALIVGKRVRTETQLGQGSLSVAATAVKLATKIVGELAGRRAIVVGAGDTGTLVARHLKAAGVVDLLMLNRTVERAAAAAAQLNCRHGGLADLRAALDDVDVLVVAVEATEPIVSRATLRGLSARRRCVVDISMPRAVAADVADQPGIFAFDIDDLAALVAAAKDERASAVQSADRILCEEVQKFLSQQSYVELTPVVHDLQDVWRKTVDQSIGRFDEAAKAEVERLSRRLLAAAHDALKQGNRRRFGIEEIRAAYAAFLERTQNA